ncbi:MAG: glycosyltransferase family A protein [Streptosporangiaceae bacterium]
MTRPGGPVSETSVAMRPPPPRRAAPWPSVTAIVATRDRPAKLARAVQSIAGQSYPGELECVIVFDQSSPAAVDVELPAGRRVRLLTNTRAPGAAGARNTGIAASDGALVAFCDDDDTWHADKLRLQVERLDGASAGFVACGMSIHYADRVVARPAPSSVSLQQLVRKRFPELVFPTLVVQRDALAEIGLLDEQIPGSYGEDYDFFLRAARRGPIVAVERPLVDVFWHQQSFFAQRWQTIIDGLGYLLGKHPELTTDPRGKARIEGQAAFAQAALGHRAAACGASVRALRGNPLERRAYLALAVAAGVIPASSIVRLANRRGRGI